MLPLRHARLWRVLSALMLGLVLLAAMSPALWFFDDRHSALRWFQNADKWLHAATFVILSLWFAGLFERRSYWKIAVGLTLFGILVEYCQMQVSYRTADLIDIGANTAGIIAGLAVAVAGLGGWGVRLEDWYVRRNQH